MISILHIMMTKRCLVQPPPHVKREDVMDKRFYFRFKDRLTRRKRQKAYYGVQKACSTLFLGVPMATLREVAAVAQEIQHREVRCLLPEFHAMQPTVCTSNKQELVISGNVQSAVSSFLLCVGSVMEP